MNSNEYFGFVYMTTNKINGKKYIGMHKGKDSDSYLGSGKLIKQAIEKNGKENFTREILAYAYSYEELGLLEIEFIKKYDAVNSTEFYNIHAGGYGGELRDGWNEERWEEYRNLLSELLSGENHPLYGKNHSNETKEKISQRQLEHWANISEEDRKEFSRIMSEAVSGEKNPNYGNKWSEEKKKQLSELRIKNGKSKGELNGMYGKKGENAITGKKVYMYDENNKLLKTFNTVGLALEFLNLKGHSQLNKAIKDKTLYKSYYWVKK
ncbi:homing endonuclease [Bacillus phage G]|uniref:Gp330 n=1 Tax=Bacillus phage G TaxID=2884420 RepID=G3MA71_9CAUD|nr:homing endonuclease [Bacillus phage G]AEO93589.1 gp330 [Bacillus phage G]